MQAVFLRLAGSRLPVQQELSWDLQYFKLKERQVVALQGPCKLEKSAACGVGARLATPLPTVSGGPSWPHRLSSGRQHISTWEDSDLRA